MQSTEQALFHRRFSPLKLGQELGQNRSLARVWKRGISLWLPGASSGTSGPPAALQPGPTLPLQCPHLLFLLSALKLGLSGPWEPTPSPGKGARAAGVAGAGGHNLTLEMGLTSSSSTLPPAPAPPDTLTWHPDSCGFCTPTRENTGVWGAPGKSGWKRYSGRLGRKPGKECFPREAAGPQGRDSKQSQGRQL